MEGHWNSVQLPVQGLVPGPARLVEPSEAWRKRRWCPVGILRPSKGIKLQPPGLFLVVKGHKFHTLGGFRYLHLAEIYGKCRSIFHPWSNWRCTVYVSDKICVKTSDSDTPPKVRCIKIEKTWIGLGIERPSLTFIGNDHRLVERIYLNQNQNCRVSKTKDPACSCSCNWCTTSIGPNFPEFEG